MKITNFSPDSLSGAVILYNPDGNVIKNILSYLDKINVLYIIDNSKETAQFISDFVKYNPGKVEYIFNNGNLGVASALNIAVDEALKDGYRYLLTMDQDSYFEEGSLEILINNLTDTKNIGILSPFHKNKYFTNPPRHGDTEELSDVMTSGNILNLAVIEKIGKFKDNYFIDYVDIEFCLRLRKNRFKIIRVNNSFLKHNEANIIKKRILWKTVYPHNHSIERWYYKIRNYFYLKEEYSGIYWEYFEKEKRNIRNSIIKIFLFEKSKSKKVKMILTGFIHYRKGIKGKLPL